jgi:hypothetical protein
MDTAWILSTGRYFVAGETNRLLPGTNAVLTPTEIILLPPARNGVKQVAPGSNFSAFVDTAGDFVHGCIWWLHFPAWPQQWRCRTHESPADLVESLVEDGCRICVGGSAMTVLSLLQVLTAGGSYGRLSLLKPSISCGLEPVNFTTV